MGTYNKLVFLNWDSAFFNLSIAKIEIKELKKNVDRLNNVIASNNIDLIYCFVDSLEGAPKEIEKLIANAKWVDGKMIYTKTIQKKKKNQSAFIEPVTKISEQLYDLAIQAGKYSRFNIDKNFKSHHYEKLYREWIEQSLNKNIADKVFVYKNMNEELGIITIGKKDNCAFIGLLAVDKLARNKGIATALLNCAEQYAAHENLKELQVVTQQQNLPACKLYEKNNFNAISLVNIFHIWK